MKLDPIKKLFLLVGIAAFLMPYFTGFFGLMPLDQSILFEAGGRISRGEILFSDFSVPYGMVPALFQALVFKLFGISWFAYITQAALFNGLFAVVVLDILRLLLPQNKISNLAKLTLLASWAFYPMVGTPFMENHSLFFSVAAYWCCLAALKRRKFNLLIFLFLFFVLAFYSKPIPAFFWLFPVALELWLFRKSFRRYFSWLFAGFLLGVLFLMLPCLLFPFKNFFYYTYLLPFHIGGKRMNSGLLIKIYIFWREFSILCICLVALFFFLWYRLHEIRPNREHFFRFSLIIAITVIGGLLTHNQFYNVTSPVLVISFFVFHELLKKDWSVHPNNWYRKIQPLLWVALIIIITQVNFRRKVNDLYFTISDLKNYSPGLGIFVSIPRYNFTVADLNKLQNLIQNRNCFYVGDMMFLYSLSHRYDPWPVTHIHDGTTYDSHDTVRYKELKKTLIRNIFRSHSDLYVQDSTWNEKQDLVHFLQPLKGRQIDSFNIIRVFEIDTTALHDVANSLNMTLEK